LPPTRNIPFYALAAAIPLMALLGWGLQRWVLERSLRAGPLVPLLATFGLAIVIENLLFEGFGADTRSLAPEIGDLAFNSWTLAGQIYGPALMPPSRTVLSRP
jgi:branched-chain amino acid transport system permease protein